MADLRGSALQLRQVRHTDATGRPDLGVDRAKARLLAMPGDSPAAKPATPVGKTTKKKVNERPERSVKKSLQKVVKGS